MVSSSANLKALNKRNFCTFQKLRIEILNSGIRLYIQIKSRYYAENRMIKISTICIEHIVFTTG